MWYVDMGIKFSDKYDAFELASYVEDTLAQPSQKVPSVRFESAGSGLGFRDMQFSTDTYAEAVIIKWRIRSYLRSQGVFIPTDRPDVTSPIEDESYIDVGSFAVLP